MPHIAIGKIKPNRPDVVGERVGITLWGREHIVTVCGWVLSNGLYRLEDDDHVFWVDEDQQVRWIPDWRREEPPDPSARVAELEAALREIVARGHDSGCPHAVATERCDCQVSIARRALEPAKAGT